MPWVTGAGTGTGIERVATGEECSVMGARGEGSDCACESDGGDSDGQGTPQGGVGVRSTNP
eukprot:scaffold96524_cov30-Phaeocystis_antarctica.AAC.1